MTDHGLPDQPWEQAERAFTLWQYDRGNPDRAADAIAGLARMIPAMSAHLPEALARHMESLPDDHPDLKAIARVFAALTGRTPRIIRDDTKWHPFVIECNRCRARARIEVQGDDPTAAQRAAMDKARTIGWVEIGSQHNCPNCAVNRRT